MVEGEEIFTSERLCAVERGMECAQTPDEIMEMGKRAPSSARGGCG